MLINIFHLFSSFHMPQVLRFFLGFFGFARVQFLFSFFEQFFLRIEINTKKIWLVCGRVSVLNFFPFVSLHCFCSWIPLLLFTVTRVQHVAHTAMMMMMAMIMVDHLPVNHRGWFFSADWSYSVSPSLLLSFTLFSDPNLTKKKKFPIVE